MLAYLIRRVAYAVPILIGVNLITFLLFFVVNTPDDIARMQLGVKRVTPEAIEPMFEKRMDGFSIAFHMLSHAKIGASTIQSRATAGVAGATYIFCLPGSPGACKDGWDGILAHQLDYRSRPCNFVEIMPRLDEHLRRPKARGATA